MLTWWGKHTRLASAAAIMIICAGQALGQARAPGIQRLELTALVHSVAVFGEDDRVPLPDEHRGLKNKIGILYDARSHAACTAFCVAQDVVATAAHCLFPSSDEKPQRFKGVRFRLGLNDVRRHAHIAGTGAGTAGQNIMVGSARLSVRPPIDATRDWGFVRLARPVCTAGGLKLAQRNATEVADLATQKRVYQVAYHRDFGDWQLAYSGPCAVRRRSENADWVSIARDFSDADQLILHLCDTGGASSGSPLLINGPSGPEVVGINIGTYVQSKVLLQNGEVVRRYQQDVVANTGVNASLLSARLAAFIDAGIIGDRSRMRQLQRLLAAHGLYAGPDDGIYGPILRSAIERYERRENLNVTGLARDTLLRQLSSPARGLGVQGRASVRLPRAFE